MLINKRNLKPVFFTHQTKTFWVPNFREAITTTAEK